MEICSLVSVNKIGVTARLDKERNDKYLAIMISVGGKFNRYLIRFLPFLLFFSFNCFLKKSR
jgi:hypothetical protein